LSATLPLSDYGRVARDTSIESAMLERGRRCRDQTAEIEK